MSEAVVLKPGRASLAEWRAIYQGAPTTLDWVARADVEAGAAAFPVSSDPPSTAATNGKPANGGTADPENAVPPQEDGSDDGRALLLERTSADGEPLPPSVARLLLALKTGSLAQGASGVGWDVVRHLADCLAMSLIPVVRVGANGEASLANLSAALLGVGEVARNGERQSAAEALESAGLTPPKLMSREALGLAGGAQVATALSLAGVFEAEAVLQTALITGAMSAEALRVPLAALHPALQRHSRSAGRIECAAALSALLTRNKPRPPEAVLAEPAGGPATLDLQAQVTGACLDLLRSAGDVLQAEANAVTESPLIVWQTGDVVEGRHDAMRTIMAADIVAIVLAHIGSLAKRRIALLAGAAPARRAGARKAPSDEFAGIQATAASLAAENRQKAWPASLASETDAVNDATAPGSPRLQRIAGNATLILAIELITASEAIEHAGRKHASDALEPIRELLRARLPRRGKDTTVVPDLAAAAELIRSGAIAAAVGIPLPSLARMGPPPTARHLGASRKRT